MLTEREVISTLDMLRSEHLDVRTVTLGLNLFDCASDNFDTFAYRVRSKINRHAKNLVAICNEVGDRYGIPVVNKRITVSPIGTVCAGYSRDQMVKVCKLLDDCATDAGVDFLGGFGALVEKGITPGERNLIDALPEALATTNHVCSSINVGRTRTGINMDAVKLMGEILLELAEQSKDRDSADCMKLVVFCNAPDDNPFMAGAFHGENGLGNVQLPLPDTAPEQTPAWDALYAAAKRMPGELRLVATGPLTNVAIALTKYPDLHGLLHSIALMGGAAVGGNVTPAAEFNIYDDPDAAQIVFKSGVPLVMCGLDVTMQAELRPADWDEMAGYGNRCGGLVKELFACAWKTIQTVGLTGVAQHDSCPVMYLAHPELFEGRMAGVFVETQGAVTLGKTVTDLQSDKKFGVQNALVLLHLDREKFMQILKDCIRTLP